MLKSGKFIIGCNYLASHAGSNMWNDWRPGVVEKDFMMLSGHGIKALRVFPNWKDFQPIGILYGGNGAKREYRFGEQPIPDTAAGRDGMSEEMLARFDEFCLLADKCGIKLIVGLLTGWLSGRLFVPPALEGLNVLKDPTALMWETRYVRHMVSRFDRCPAIGAWDLGNECNCMAYLENADGGYAWTSLITATIRSCKTEKPIVSGMHSLLPEKSSWTIQHQGELTDILTTHPYPYWTPHCAADPLNTIRTELHSTAESLFYRGVGGKPCFVEECGTLGQMFAGDECAAEFVRAVLFSLWAHDCMGFFWWCAFEQSHLRHAPYDWDSVERELGLFYSDFAAKPVLTEISRFNNMLGSLSFGALPKRIIDGVCVLTSNQDTWGVAYMSFILAKQAGLDIEFAYAEQPLPEASLYLLPSVCGHSAISSKRYQKLLEKVYNGAVLYISVDNALLSPFTEIAGLKVINRCQSDGARRVRVDTGEGALNVGLRTPYKLNVEPLGARIIGADEGGVPVFSEHVYGNGKVYFLAAPLERDLCNAYGAFDGEEGYYKFYEVIRKSCATRKAAEVKNKNIALTEHEIDGGHRIIVLINHGPSPQKAELVFNGSWGIHKFHYGGLELPGNGGSVIEITK